MTVLLRGGVDAAGLPLELRTDPATGTVVDRGAVLERLPGDEVVPCDGMVLLPAPVEPHAHLDKALSAGRAPNPRGDLEGAIAAWHAYWPQLDEDDLHERGRAAAHELVAHGTTAIRTHVDVGQEVGLKAVRAIGAVRDELARDGLCDVQIVALVGRPLGGPDGAPQRALLEQALDAGCDVVGGCPHLDPDPVDATRVAFELARERGLPLDLHTDEQLDPGAFWLPGLLALVEEHGSGAGVAASHCVSLASQPPAVQQAAAARAAATGVAVITLPQTNLYLQARDVATTPPRGLTAVRALLDAGATLAAGADNVRDPFCAVGRSDALETAALLVMAAHLTPEEAWTAVSGAARRALGLPPVTLAAGSPAEVLAVRGASLADAIARGSEHRTVLHRGRVVARTAVHADLKPLSTLAALP